MALKSWMRSGMVLVGASVLVVAGWACNKSSGGDGTGGAGGTCSGVPATGEAGGAGGGCQPASYAPTPPPTTTCDPCGDIFKECPLPLSQTNDDGEETTIYYFSNPTCKGGTCHYCVTTTVSEDPGVTDTP